MQKPLEILLKRKDLDIPFCLSWMAVWNSGSIKLIYEPESAKEDAEKFMRDILPYFKDSRYIKISKKPLLIIYPIELFEKEYIKLMIASFRKIAKENDFEAVKEKFNTGVRDIREFENKVVNTWTEEEHKKNHQKTIECVAKIVEMIKNK